MSNTLKASFVKDGVEYIPTWGDFTRWANGGPRIHYFESYITDEDGDERYLGKFLISTNNITRAVVHEAMQAYLHKHSDDMETVYMYANPSRVQAIGEGTDFDPRFAYFDESETKPFEARR
jgi:hypothetical protein